MILEDKFEKKIENEKENLYDFFFKNYKNFLKNNSKEKFLFSNYTYKTFQEINKFIEISEKNICYFLGNKGYGKTHLIGTILNSYKNKFKTIHIDSQNFIDKFYECKKLKKDFDSIKNWILEHQIIIFDSIQIIKKTKQPYLEYKEIIKKLLEDKRKIILIADSEDFICNKSIPKNYSEKIILSTPDLIDIEIIVNKFLNKYNPNLKFSNDCISFISENSLNNIQDIIDTLSKMLIFFKNSNTPEIIDLEKIKKHYKKLNNSKRNKNYSSICNHQIKVICKKLNISPEEILSKTRKKNIVFNRNIVIYFLKKKFNITHEEIGKVFGKTHSTISHSIEFVEEKLKDKYFKKYINFLI